MSKAPKKRPPGRPKGSTTGRKESYNYERSPIYWREGYKAAVEAYCKRKEIKKVNDFIMDAIAEKLRRG